MLSRLHRRIGIFMVAGLASVCRTARKWDIGGLLLSRPRPQSRLRVPNTRLRVSVTTSSTMVIASSFPQQLQRRNLLLSADRKLPRSPPSFPRSTVVSSRRHRLISTVIPLGAAAHQLPGPYPSLVYAPFSASLSHAIER
jgi:hypothetical protein